MVKVAMKTERIKENGEQKDSSGVNLLLKFELMPIKTTLVEIDWPTTGQVSKSTIPSLGLVTENLVHEREILCDPRRETINIANVDQDCQSPQTRCTQF